MTDNTMRVGTDFLVGLLRPYQAAIIDVPRLGERWTDFVPTMSLTPTAYEKEAEFFPALVDLKRITADQSNQFYETLREEHSTGLELTAQVLLNSDQDGDTLRKHWINHVVVSMGLQGKALLRSYDPRVFLQLRRILTAVQLKSLFGPITTWTIYWQGAWLSFDAPQAASGFLQPTAAQADQIVRIEAINQVLSLLAAPDSVLPGRAKLAPIAVPAYASHAKAYDAMSERIDSLLIQAAQRGWPRQQDAVLFALLGLLLSPGWHQQPDMAALLAKADRSEQTLQDVLSLLPQEQWTHLSAQLASIA